MGWAEPWEKVTDGESRTTLDRGLPCWDSGRMDRRRIHELLDETESRETSEMGGWAQSLCRMKECRRLEALGGVVCVAAGREGRKVWAPPGPGGCGGERSKTSKLARSIARSGAVGDVAKGDEGRGGRGLLPFGASFLLFEVGREALDSAGWPKTRPAVAAATTVPVPTSCEDERVSDFLQRHAKRADEQNSWARDKTGEIRFQAAEDHVQAPGRGG